METRQSLLLTGFQTAIAVDEGSGETFASLALELWSPDDQKTQTLLISVPAIGMTELAQAIPELAAKLAMLQARAGRA